MANNLPLPNTSIFYSKEEVKSFIGNSFLSNTYF